MKSPTPPIFSSSGDSIIQAVRTPVVIHYGVLEDWKWTETPQKASHPSRVHGPELLPSPGTAQSAGDNPAGSREHLPAAQAEKDELECGQLCAMAFPDGCVCSSSSHRGSVTSRAVAFRDLFPGPAPAGARRCGCCALPTGGSEPSPFGRKKKKKKTTNKFTSLWAFWRLLGIVPTAPAWGARVWLSGSPSGEGRASRCALWML